MKSYFNFSHSYSPVWGLFFVFLIFFFAGCGNSQEEFEDINFMEFNQRIQTDRSITTPEELMKRYYFLEGEGEVSISATKEGWFGESYRIVLVHEGVPDDSMASFQVVMYAEKISDDHRSYWQVSELKKNFRCQEGRGHTNWGIDWCE